MDKYPLLILLRKLLILGLLILAVACAHAPQKEVKPQISDPTLDRASQASNSDIRLATCDIPAPINVPDSGAFELLPSIPLTPPQPASKPTRVSVSPTPQEYLDRALDLCQLSNRFWEEGDLDNALSTLDQAYSLILRVPPESPPELLQQKDDLRVTISKRIIEIYGLRHTSVRGYHKAIPLVMNRHVHMAIQSFLGKERDYFLEAYRRSGRYRPAILKALKRAGLPEELSWLPLIESGFKIRALSRARALGLWQFIASTGYKFGLKRTAWIDERMDPEKSTRAAIAYLKELHSIFGDWTTVLAAYNCGEGTVLKRIRSQRINYLDNFWDLYETLPRETAAYVPKFLAVLHILNHPEEFGIKLPRPDPPLDYDEVTVDKPLHLASVAKSLGLSTQILKNLNPELRYAITPSGGYKLRVPKGKAALLLAKLDQIPAAPLANTRTILYRVRKGDSLCRLARRYNTSVRAIMLLNHIKRPHYLRVGWRLKIPVGKKRLYREASFTPAAISGPCLDYFVRRGDSLWKIANRFGITPRAIKTINHLRGNRIQIGQLLKIPLQMKYSTETEQNTTQRDQDKSTT